MAQSKPSHQSVCSGDSGSPLVFNKKVIGIVSIGVAACDETIRPSAYTEVSKYLDFINGVLNGKFTNDTLIKSPVG
ncbi:alpha- and beta-fibrinogenase OhS1-like [Copidosoma floridanum]|uniref:alpha- and beta-fibrinogenase OhS1-like n=1 Tax=Copidosoma floridanum TaxID=29053 RepID=UPI0006C9979E|nr:alpha- and beta-fibrinogenase OhS1-like [Copidosoma floridanum]XP_023247800.1 alpha- and beta-fibrinogenase OhS1-like [Copidosoma floridanum]